MKYIFLLAPDAWSKQSCPAQLELRHTLAVVEKHLFFSGLRRYLRTRAQAVPQVRRSQAVHFYHLPVHLTKTEINNDKKYHVKERNKNPSSGGMKGWKNQRSKNRTIEDIHRQQTMGRVKIQNHLGFGGSQFWSWLLSFFFFSSKQNKTKQKWNRIYNATKRKRHKKKAGHLQGGGGVIAHELYGQ